MRDLFDKVEVAADEREVAVGTDHAVQACLGCRCFGEEFAGRRPRRAQLPQGAPRTGQHRERAGEPLEVAHEVVGEELGCRWRSRGCPRVCRCGGSVRNGIEERGHGGTKTTCRNRGTSCSLDAIASRTASIRKRPSESSRLVSSRRTRAPISWGQTLLARNISWSNAVSRSIEPRTVLISCDAAGWPSPWRPPQPHQAHRWPTVSGSSWQVACGTTAARNPGGVPWFPGQAPG